jgi:hypothetical protein
VICDQSVLPISGNSLVKNLRNTAFVNSDTSKLDILHDACQMMFGWRSEAKLINFNHLREIKISL